MTGLNKSLIVFALLLTTACETTGDLRSKRSSDPGEIKTVENPIIPQQSSSDTERELAVTKGRLAEIETLRQQEKTALLNQIAQLEKERNELLALFEKQKQTKKEKPAPTKSGQDGFKLLWDQAFAQIKIQKYSSAANIFEEITKRYPSRSGTFYAHLGTGMAHYSSGKYKDAAIAFNDLLDKYSKHRKRSLATFGLGASFSMLKKNKDAQIFFDEVKSISPRSVHGVLSARIMAKKQRVPKDLFLAIPKWYQ